MALYVKESVKFRDANGVNLPYALFVSSLAEKNNFGKASVPFTREDRVALQSIVRGIGTFASHLDMDKVYDRFDKASQDQINDRIDAINDIDGIKSSLWYAISGSAGDGKSRRFVLGLTRTELNALYHSFRKEGDHESSLVKTEVWADYFKLIKGRPDPEEVKDNNGSTRWYYATSIGNKATAHTYPRIVPVYEESFSGKETYDPEVTEDAYGLKVAEARGQDPLKHHGMVKMPKSFSWQCCGNHYDVRGCWMRPGNTKERQSAKPTLLLPMGKVEGKSLAQVSKEVEQSIRIGSVWDPDQHPEKTSQTTLYQK